MIMNNFILVRVLNVQRSRTHLLHVLGDGVLTEELHRLARVEALGVLEERVLEVLLVHAQRRTL